MYFQRTERKEFAVLIEKKIIQTHDSSKEVRSLYRMKFGLNNVHENNRNLKGKAYILIFMTKKGRKQFFVEPAMYNQIRIDSYVELTVLKDIIQSYNFIRIMKKKDLENLDW